MGRPQESSIVPGGAPLPPDRACAMRRTATGMLFLMAAVFILSARYLDVHPAWGYVHAFAEAAMVGGLADWFAVTALFRRPLGLPIPHTAIIPRNKDRIGDTMAQFLRSNFLTPLVVARRMRSMNVAAAAGRFLVQPTGGEGRLRLGASNMVADVLEGLRSKGEGGDPEVEANVRQRVRALCERFPIYPEG